MERRDWNLLVLSAAIGEPLSPVQLQKSLFLLEKTLGAELLGDAFYQFEPYSYGPFDPNVYSDVGVLASHGFAKVCDSSSGRWKEYAPTPSGIERAEQLKAMLPPGVSDYVKKLVRWVRGQSFTSLVRWVYDHYPAMREKSVFRD